MLLFNDAVGYGLIRPDDGGEDVYVHHSNLLMLGFRTVSGGDRVTFRRVEAENGPVAEDVRVIEKALIRSDYDYGDLGELHRRLEEIKRRAASTPASPDRLRVFMCHSSSDKPFVRTLYRKLEADGFDPWLDEESLLPGQDWASEITHAVKHSDVVLVCLSRASVQKTGFVQREIRLALDAADERPEGTIYLIPVRLEECTVPTRISKWHYVDYFNESGHTRLLRALRERARQCGRFVPP